MRISHLDHRVSTVSEVEASRDFHARVLGFERIEFGQGRIAPGFARDKIDPHPGDARIEPRASDPDAKLVEVSRPFDESGAG